MLFRKDDVYVALVRSNCAVQSLLDPVLGVTPAVAAVAGDTKGKEDTEKGGVHFLDSDCQEVNVYSTDHSGRHLVDHSVVVRWIIR